MKRILVISFVLLLATLSVAAQTEKRLNSAPRAFRTFYAGFKQAVNKGDKTRVVSMTRFPFKYAFDAGDEGTMSRSQFTKAFKRVFGDKPGEFQYERNPMFSRGDAGSYVVSTESAEHLIFAKIGSTFKFTAYLVEP